MFGFLHEIKDVENLLIKLKKKLNSNFHIIVSDNDLYRSAEELSERLKIIDKDCIVYSSKSFFRRFHIFTKIFGSVKKKIYCIHKGRVDKIIGFCSSLKKKEIINWI